ncbi:antibiotic biosynthesis monooxygenase [Shewanella electrodiphila]|uniref:Antibiotic biosynthesis monooxygenase n=1 Tax=Shewanella electrodiphila TaxID=934143 RepID=A0ABT0KNV7_9GAMM|nr:antibiotic biosynthesis monooxygenase [Shewanella electrodiphila]MCL1045540.1 antibiotic biosynthesis monooxygenase [Shewanella electrodiphila]
METLNDCCYFRGTNCKRQSAKYLGIASELKPLLVDIDGFISIERFQSLTNEDKILSLSFWRDEESIQDWRNIESHLLAQSKGINSVFENYRLRVAGVIRDYGSEQREDAPQGSLSVHDC